MCIYCNAGDWAFKYNPPWRIPYTDPNYPYVPQPKPIEEIRPWNIKQLEEYLKILKEIKEMEEKIGCPCIPNKADYIKLFEKRIEKLKKKNKKKQ